MQNFTKQNLFNITADGAEKAKKAVIDHKKPILIWVAVILFGLIAYTATWLLTPEKSSFDLLVEKQQNNLIIIGDQLEIQKDLRSERNELQAKIDALNVQINASKEVVTKAETANQEIKTQMLDLANPLPLTNTGDVK